MKMITRFAAAAALMAVALSASAFSTGHISPHEFEPDHSSYSERSHSSSYRSRHDEPAYAHDTSGYTQNWWGERSDSEEEDRKRREDRYEDFEPPTHVRIR